MVEVPPPAISQALKRRWAHFIKQVYEADPLLCPQCGGPMRIIASIEQPGGIDLPVPGTADREDPHPPRALARPGPQPAGTGYPLPFSLQGVVAA